MPRGVKAETTTWLALLSRAQHKGYPSNHEHVVATRQDPHGEQMAFLKRLNRDKEPKTIRAQMEEGGRRAREIRAKRGVGY
jgi:hypothetical protein